MFDVGKLGDGGRVHVTAIEDLAQVHLGHAPRGVVGVVVALGVDHHAVENALHLDLDLVEQLLKLAGFDEIGDVVVRVKALTRGHQALTDLDRDGGAFVLLGRAHGVGCFL